MDEDDSYSTDEDLFDGDLSLTDEGPPVDAAARARMAATAQAARARLAAQARAEAEARSRERRMARRTLGGRTAAPGERGLSRAALALAGEDVFDEPDDMEMA